MHSNSTQTQVAGVAVAAAAVVSGTAAAVSTTTTGNQGNSTTTTAPASAHRKNVISCVSVQDSDNEERSSSKVFAQFILIYRLVSTLHFSSVYL